MVSHPHEVLLGPPRDLAAWPDEGSGAPAILQRSDDRFIEAVLAALRDPAGRIALRDDLARAGTPRVIVNAAVDGQSTRGVADGVGWSAGICATS